MIKKSCAKKKAFGTIMAHRQQNEQRTLLLSRSFCWQIGIAAIACVTSVVVACRLRQRVWRARHRVVVVIVHLKRRVDRRANVDRMRRLALAAGFAVHVLDAFDDASDAKSKPLRVPPFTDMSSSRGPFRRSHLRRGEQGCLRSHMAAWRFVRRNYATGMIMEDDAIVRDDAFDIVSRFLASRDSSRSLFVYGRFSAPKSFPNAWNTPGPTTVVRVMWPCYNSNALLVSNDVARRLETFARRQALPVDDLLSRFIGYHPDVREDAAQVDAYAFSPSVLHVMSSKSDTAL
jgi:GR25 family glycosyltransferase involved in LPS biosynthesis